LGFYHILKPSGWFDAGHFSLLVQCCRISARHEKLVSALNELDGQVPADFLETEIHPRSRD
jgi:hypothetical protein